MYDLSNDKAFGAYISGMIQYLREPTAVANTTPFRTLDKQVEVWPRRFGTGIAGTTLYHVIKQGEGYVLVTKDAAELYRFLVDHIRETYNFRYTIESCVLMADWQTPAWVLQDTFLYTPSIQGLMDAWGHLESTPTTAYRLIDWRTGKPHVFGIKDDYGVMEHNKIDISVS